MMCLIVIIFPGLFLSGNGKQVYRLIPQYANVSYVRPEYVEVHEWAFKKYNKTAGAMNIVFTFKQNVDDSFADHITGYLFKSNEFKKTALDFDLKLCSLFERLQSFDIGHMLENSNVTLKCPIRKGTYYAYDIIPDAENFPPLVPAGKWLFKQEFKLHGIHITTLDLVWVVEYI